MATYLLERCVLRSLVSCETSASMRVLLISLACRYLSAKTFTNLRKIRIRYDNLVLLFCYVSVLVK